MSDFKIGDFVRSDTSEVFIGIIIDQGEEGRFEVAWHDGDYTYGENERTMFHHEMKPTHWTDYLYKAFSDFFCP